MREIPVKLVFWAAQVTAVFGKILPGKEMVLSSESGLIATAVLPFHLISGNWNGTETGAKEKIGG